MTATTAISAAEEIAAFGRGRRVDPESREQFAKWVKQTYEWGSKSRLNQLQVAHELVPILLPTGNGIQPTGERSLRPLFKLRDQGYGDRQVDGSREPAPSGGAPGRGRVGHGPRRPSMTPPQSSSSLR